MATEALPAFLRLFIAVAVPPEVRREIGRIQGQLRRCTPPGAVRWAQAEQFHLTLKFMGDMTPKQAEALREPVARISAGFLALQLYAHGIGCFPNANHPRVIWAGVSDATGRLAELQRCIEEAMQPFAPSQRVETFNPHITLGRFKPGHHGQVKPVMERATTLCDRHFGNWQAEEVVIYRSLLTSNGAVHEAYQTFHLAV